jgi:hypothetical protein
MQASPRWAWNVPEEFWLLLWRSRWGRTLIVQVEGEPRRKNQKQAPAADFQRQVLDAMENYRRYPFTGTVALDLHFRATRRNPPSIQQMAKNTLDLLGRALPGNERPRRRSVLYRDDRQVKFLYVSLDQAWHRDGSGASRPGSTFITARRASDVITDLCMTYRLSSGHYDDEDEKESPFWVPGLPDDPDPDWLADPGPHATALQQFLAKAARFRYVTELQEAILGRTGALLAAGLSMYLEDHTRTRKRPAPAAIFEESRAGRRELLLSGPFALPLPGLPRASGQTDEFTRQIRASLAGFRSNWPLFASLVVPVTLTLLVVPPKQGKDLDNLALTTLPIAHEVLRPHIAPHLLSPHYQDDGQQPTWRTEALARLKSVNAQSVSAYQVIELPRSAQDPEEGLLRLALSSYTHRSWWDHATSYLEETFDRAGDQQDLAKEILETPRHRLVINTGWTHWQVHGQPLSHAAD